MALIVAYWNIRQSDKQNKANTELQILLLKHGVEQNRLDELIESILIIYTPNVADESILSPFSLRKKFLKSIFRNNIKRTTAIKMIFGAL